MSYEQITSEVEDRVLTITLNRPDKLNAITHQMNNEIIDALDRADADDEVRAVIMTGSGRAFCAGADMSAGADTFDYDARAEGSGAGRADEVDWGDPRIRDGGGLALSQWEWKNSELSNRAQHGHVVVSEPSGVDRDRIDIGHPIENTVGQVTLPCRHGRMMWLG